MREAIYYTLSRPVSTMIMGCDTVAQLEENVQLAREFTPLSDGQQEQLVARAERLRKAVACSSGFTIGRKSGSGGGMRSGQSIPSDQSLSQLGQRPNQPAECFRRDGLFVDKNDAAMRTAFLGPGFEQGGAVVRRS